jgi:hypothetical protein
LARVEELEKAKSKLAEINNQKRFEQWVETVPEEERNKLAPPNSFIKSGSQYQLTMLKDYWEKEVDNLNAP